MFDSLFPSHWTTLRKLMWLKLKGASAAWETITGNPVSFTSLAAPLRKLQIAFSPVQTGSGDPSPTNVRPISGWSTLGVEQRGKNLWKPSDCTKVSWNLQFPNPLKGFPVGTKVTYSIDSFGDDGKSAILQYFKGNTWASLSSWQFGKTQFVVTREIAQDLSDAELMQLGGGWNGLTAEVAEAAHFQIELSDERTEYQPHTGRSISINLGSTYYSGWVDAVTGIGEVTWAAVDMGSLDWSYTSPSAGIPYGYFDVTNIGYKPTGGLMCSCYKVVPSGWAVDKTIRNHGSIDKLYVIDGSYDNKNSFKQAVTGQYICYELATPLAIQLTPQEVNSLAGDNTMWTDATSLEVTYRSN